MAGKAQDGQIFVGGLSWCTTERMLEGAFRRFGKIVDVRVITERHTGRSRGFGFVTFSDPRAASNAIAFMHCQAIDGRTISVFRADPQRMNFHSGKGYGAVHGGQDGHCLPRYGNGFSWDHRHCPDGFGIGHHFGRFFSEFTVRGDFFHRQGGRFDGDRHHANDGYFHHWGGGGCVGADRCGYGSGGDLDRRGYGNGGGHQRGRSCDRGGAPRRCHGRSASRGPAGRRHRSASRPRGGGGSRGREIVTMTVKFSRAIV
nr:glycine-rich RNA-binding protein GRP2A-like [Lolium perenne]